MRYWFDTEFYEHDRSVELISIGIVAEDGREYYGENHAFDWEMIEALAHHPHDRVSGTPNWLLENVKPHLTGPRIELWPVDIRADILEFVGVEEKPEFWAYYADYDWVVFAQTIGRMIDLPRIWPKYCRDIKQWADELGGPKLPAQTSTEHNALADARWNREAWEFLRSLEGDRDR